MPPRYAYWTIILEGKPTAFRAHTREELLPTLKQLQSRHPNAAMLWFARGRLWQSPEEERAAAEARHQNRERRGSGWRPGGEHRDPRDRFKVPRDEKRRRFAAKRRRDRDEGAVGGGGDRPSSGGGKPDRSRPGRPDRQRSDSPGGWRPRGPGPGGHDDRKPGGGGRGRPSTGGGRGGGRGRGGGGGSRGGRGGPR